MSYARSHLWGRGPLRGQRSLATGPRLLVLKLRYPVDRSSLSLQGRTEGPEYPPRSKKAYGPQAYFHVWRGKKWYRIKSNRNRMWWWKKEESDPSTRVKDNGYWRRWRRRGIQWRWLCSHPAIVKSALYQQEQSSYVNCHCSDAYKYIYK